MTTTKKIKVLKKEIEENGDLVVLYLADFYKTRLERAKGIVEKRHNSIDWRDFVYKELKISDLIAEVEDGNLEYDGIIRDIMFGKYAFNKSYRYDTLEKSVEQYEKYYANHKDVIDDYYDELNRMYGRITSEYFKKY